MNKSQKSVCNSTKLFPIYFTQKGFHPLEKNAILVLLYTGGEDLSQKLFLSVLVVLLLVCCACSQQNTNHTNNICEPAKVVSPNTQDAMEEQSPSDPQTDSQPAPDIPGADPGITKDAVSGDGFLTENENQLMNLINKERLSLGLNELEYDPMLHNTARIRSKELCQDENMQTQELSHTRPDGSVWSTVLTRDIPIPNLVEAGEILAREKTTNGDGCTQEPIPAKDWFLLWKASQPHYDTITWPEAQTIGVGIYYEIRNGEYYTNATVHFGIYSDDLTSNDHG